MKSLLRVYLAGPLFSEMERGRNRALRDALSPFAEVFLPQEDGSLLTDLVANGCDSAEAKRLIFCNDLTAIRQCDIVLIVLDGRCVDEGACVELGYAYALQKICVGIKTDSRSLLSFGDNPMIEGALSVIFNDDCSAVRWFAEKQARLQSFRSQVQR